MLTVCAKVEFKDGSHGILLWKAQPGDGKPEDPYSTEKAQAYLDAMWKDESQKVVDAYIVFVCDYPHYPF